MATGPAAYALDRLGWVQFERLGSLALAHALHLKDLHWFGHADQGRVAMVDEPVRARELGVRLRGPVAVVIAWAPERACKPMSPVPGLLGAVLAVPTQLGSWLDRLLVVTNLDSVAARDELAGQPLTRDREIAVLGARELSSILDRDPGLRAAMPSLLGFRDLAPLIDPVAGERSNLPLDEATALARVFWPTQAYQRARAVVARHRFVVLTGPPEMGKTAIARMLALAQLADGWEAHEANAPEHVWRAYDARRRQVFVADDAFGSTEYRPESAERWARELGRILAALDADHWLVWTSRPAPLKAGLRRVQRERGAERFPAPAEVLVDASRLDLAEKTMILFRHAKDREASPKARELLREAGVGIVEHPHFTPERIRRFVIHALEPLASGPLGLYRRRLLAAVEDELARPTEAMRISYRALASEHRELLVALLDAPAGWIGERELAAAVRRHHSGGLSRPPHELIDRLTDHFLRVTPAGIGWVHPSWRDLVIGELQADGAARRRFLGACGIDGTALALSREGGAAGERALPLLIDDADWDRLGDRIAQQLPGLEDQQLARLLLALADVLEPEPQPGWSGTGAASQATEADSLADYLLSATSRAWARQGCPVPVFAIEAWYALNAVVSMRQPSPPLAATWAELHPASVDLVAPLTSPRLAAFDEWLALAETLRARDPRALVALRFFDDDRHILRQLALRLSDGVNPDQRALAEAILSRIERLLPQYESLAGNARAAVRGIRAQERRWWVPSDLAAPPSHEPVAQANADFTADDVERVLSDL